MFGVTSPASNSSPVIRRAGSKPVLSEQDYSDPGSGYEEGPFLSADIEQMKSGSLPIHAASILPSPVLLWRLKVLLFLLLGVSCCKIGWDSVMRMSVDLRDLFLYEAFLYYNPLLLATLMIWLWGINLWVFAQSTVNYAKIFDLDNSHLTHWEIWKCATWMTIIVPTSTYLRNGPGLWHIDDYNFRHLFDGYATLVRLCFDHGRLVFAHRQIESDAYKAAVKNRRLCYREFSEAPKPDSFLSYVGDLASLFSGASLTDNANTGVVVLGDGRVVCLTETIKGSIVIDPDTLDTLGKFEYADGMGGLIHSAHPIVTASEFLTLLPDLVRPGYSVVRMEAGSNERRFIGRVDCRGGPAPGWVHSFPVTEHYVVVPEMCLRYCAQNLLRAEPTPLYKFEWHPDSGSYVHVMCKASGKVVASVEVPNFVTFHFINAYEETDEDGRVTAVVADCCEHGADTSILDKLRLQNLRSSAGQDVLPDARVGRFRIPLDGSPKGELYAALDPNEHGRGMDMCSINRAHLGKKYRYAYACGAHRPCNFPNTLTKIDLVEKKAKNWYDEGAIPSEPFFVARPGATEEDDGVVISMVSDKNGEGYALVLDGTSFEEIARAKFPYGLPYGLHGCWVPKEGK